MTAEQVVSYLLEGEEGLVSCPSRRVGVVQRLMEAEVSELIGAERGERNPGGWPTATAIGPGPGDREQGADAARRRGLG